MPKEMTERFEMKCSPEDYAEWTAAAHRRHQTLSAFVRDAARQVARATADEPTEREVQIEAKLDEILGELRELREERRTLKRHG